MRVFSSTHGIPVPSFLQSKLKNHKSALDDFFNSQVPGLFWAHGQQPPERLFEAAFESTESVSLVVIIWRFWNSCCIKEMIYGKQSTVYGQVLIRTTVIEQISTMSGGGNWSVLSPVPSARFVSCAMLQQLGYFIGCLEDGWIRGYACLISIAGATRSTIVVYPSKVFGNHVKQVKLHPSG